MNIKIAKNSKDFYSSYYEYLDENQTELQLFFENLICTKVCGSVNLNDDVTILFLVNTKNELFIISFIEDAYLGFLELANYFIENKIKITSLKGLLADCQEFVLSYSDEVLLNLHYKNWIMECVNRCDNLKGKLVKPTIENFPLLEKSLFYYFYENNKLELSEKQMNDKINSCLSNPYFYLYKNEGNEVTSFIEFDLNTLKDVGLVKSVFTLPKYRNLKNGYNMLGLSLNLILEEKKAAALINNPANKISTKLFESLGFINIIETYEFKK